MKSNCFLRSIIVRKIDCLGQIKPDPVGKTKLEIVGQYLFNSYKKIHQKNLFSSFD